MKLFVAATFLLAAGLAAAACNGRVDEPTTSTSCPTGQRFLNGQCRQECATSSTCAAGSRCVALDAEGGVCIAEAQAECAYLGSDTKCVGIDGYYFSGFRGGSEYVPLPSEPSGATPDGLGTARDDAFATNGPYPYEYNGSQGCQGDATYVKVAVTTDPACSERHAVVRCRRVGNACRLVAGTTPERFAP
jgi:hypothetical protein